MRMIQPGNAAEWELVRELFLEYWRSFGFSPCFQGFESEVATLPGAYAPPGGALVLALTDGQAAGCSGRAIDQHGFPGGQSGAFLESCP